MRNQIAELFDRLDTVGSSRRRAPSRDPTDLVCRDRRAARTIRTVERPQQPARSERPTVRHAHRRPFVLHSALTADATFVTGGFERHSAATPTRWESAVASANLAGIPPAGIPAALGMSATDIATLAITAMTCFAIPGLAIPGFTVPVATLPTAILAHIGRSRPVRHTISMHPARISRHQHAALH